MIFVPLKYTMSEVVMVSQQTSLSASYRSCHDPSKVGSQVLVTPSPFSSHSG